MPKKSEIAREILKIWTENKPIRVPELNRRPKAEKYAFSRSFKGPEDSGLVEESILAKTRTFSFSKRPAKSKQPQT